MFSTYLGGTSRDEAHGVAVDFAANLYVVGRTFSTDFPVVDPVQGALGGGIDTIVAKIEIPPRLRRGDDGLRWLSGRECAAAAARGRPRRVLREDRPALESPDVVVILSPAGRRLASRSAVQEVRPLLKSLPSEARTHAAALMPRRRTRPCLVRERWSCIHRSNYARVAPR
jgi:hypothetical protein